MGALLLVGGLGLLALPGVGARPGRRLPPHEWARLCRAALVAGAVVVESCALLYALPTVLRAAGVPALASACEKALGLYVPGGHAAGWAAAAAASTIASLAAVGLRRARRFQQAARAEPWLGEHHPFNGHDLVVLPSDCVLAVSVAGTPSQIIVSDGLVDALSQTQLDLVLRHEAAHLDLKHQRSLAVAAALDHGFAFWPPARRSTAALRLALERWADEEAVGAVPGRRRELHSALLGVSGMTAAVPALATFSPAATVAERLDALDRDQPRPSPRLRWLLYLPGAANLGVIGVALGASGGEARMLICMAGRCLT